MASQILSVHSSGTKTRYIVDLFKGIYHADVSNIGVSKVTNAVIDAINEWLNRPLDSIYLIV